MDCISSQRLIDLARVAAVIACVGFLYSPSVATIGMIVCYVAFVAGGRESVRRFNAVLIRPLAYWGIVFLGFVLLWTAYASVPWHERWADFYKWRTILWFLVLLAVFHEDRWKKRLLLLFIIGTAVALAGSFISAAGWITFRRGPHELLRNAGTQGMAFACAALVCAWVVLEKKALGPAVWIWSVLGVSYIANVIFITDARSGYVVLGLGLFILLCWKASWRDRALIVVGLLVASGLAFSASSRMQDKINAAVTQWTTESELESNVSFASRRVFYTNSLEILKENWLLGVGTGGFAQTYAGHVSKKYDALNWRAVPTTDPHNQYLFVAIQQGVAGLALFFLWIAALVREREAPSEYHRLAIAILAGWCVTSLFSSHFRTFAEGHILATFLGVLLAVEAPPSATPPGVEPVQDI